MYPKHAFDWIASNFFVSYFYILLVIYDPNHKLEIGVGRILAIRKREKDSQYDHLNFSLMNNQNPKTTRPEWNIKNLEDRVKDYRTDTKNKHQIPTEQGWFDRVKDNITDTWEDTKDAASEAWRKTMNWADDTWESATNERKNPNY